MSGAGHPAPPRVQRRTIEFVHGINGNFQQFQCSDLAGGFAAILSQVCRNPQSFRDDSFAYYQDKGFVSSGQCNTPTPDTMTGLLFVDPNSVNPGICDSKGALAYSAAALDKRIASLAGPVTVVANSMGGAITRGWLSLANFNHDASLAHADSVIFLQGAQSGSWAAAAGEAAAANPTLGPILTPISHLAGLDLNRPGVIDVTPLSLWYDSVNPSMASPGVPPALAYYNFYSNLVINSQINLGFFKLNTGSFDAGDLVMLPGSDNPIEEPLLGGEKFLPGGAQAPNRHEFAMDRQVNINPVDLSIPPLLARDITRILASPITHFQFPNMDGTVDVKGCGPGSPSVTAASEVFRILQNPTRGCAS